MSGRHPGAVKDLSSLGMPLLSLWTFSSVLLYVHSLWLCEGRGGRPGLPSLIVLMVSVDDGDDVELNVLRYRVVPDGD